jgi:energy-coupling factor transport system permease protein
VATVLKDITFGQYIFSNSIIHKLDARLKIICTVLFIVMVFVWDNIAAIGVNILFIAAMFLVARIPIRMVGKSLKPMLPILLFTAILNMFFVSGDPLIHFWIITITKQGVYFVVQLSLKIICLIAGSSLLTYTTSPLELTFAIEKLLTPFKLFKLPVHELAMMMTIAMRMIPTLIEETDKIMSAQKSRGASLDTGKFIQRVKALVPILVPLFISSFRRADELALAMECRCYHGGEGRTRLKIMQFAPRDAAAFAVFLSALALVVSAHYLVPPLLP